MNGLVNRAGTTFAFRIGEETGASGADIVRAHEAARGDRRPGSAVARHRGARLRRSTSTCRPRCTSSRASSWSARAAGSSGTASVRSRSAATVEFFAAPFARADDRRCPTCARGSERERLDARGRGASSARGVPPSSRRASPRSISCPTRSTSPSSPTARSETSTGSREVYAIIGDRLRLDWLHDRIVELPRADRWDALARNALREDVAAEHRAIAEACCAPPSAGHDPEAAFDALGRRPAVRRRPHARDPRRHHDPRRLRPRHPLGRPPGAPRPHLCRCV